MSDEPREIFQDCDPNPAIAIGQHMADLQFDVAESSYSERLDQNYKGFCLTQARDETMSRYLGEYVAIVRLDERLRFISRTLFYGLLVAIIPVGCAIAVGMSVYSALLLIPALMAGMWLAAVNH